MLFFQVFLLGGYLYAHLIATKLTPRSQVFLHLGLLAVSLGFLNILPSDAWRPSGYEAPAWRILCLLGVNIGVPYLVLSATSPLLQAWFNSAEPGRKPYRLYALSNAGSLLALLSYLFIFEPLLTLKTQAAGWAGVAGAPQKSLALDALIAGAPPVRPQPLDILVLDAFTGDAIPLHLLTREAFEIYFKRLRPGGVLAVHVSNQFIDLEPLVHGLALERGKKAVVIRNPQNESRAVEESAWVLVTGNEKFLNDPLVRESVLAWPENCKTIAFTDQYSNLFRLLSMED